MKYRKVRFGKEVVERIDEICINDIMPLKFNYDFQFENIKRGGVNAIVSSFHLKGANLNPFYHKIVELSPEADWEIVEHDGRLFLVPFKKRFDC